MKPCHNVVNSSNLYSAAEPGQESQPFKVTGQGHRTERLAIITCTNGITWIQL